MNQIINDLIDKGVTIYAPASQWINVKASQIAPNTVLYPGSRITGKDTSIGPGCIIGQEAPVTIDNCQLGHGVRLKGGYFNGATFLDGVSFGSSAHVRPGTLLEEQANAAHCVGLKQTILLPFVTLGSLINFCDCLMSGGTSRKNHSEVGSSYIHFNFTPHQDKATPSLFGCVSKGVFLNQKPIFLGGQGGCVGPVQVEYGNIIAAGAILRNDIKDIDKLLIPKTLSEAKLNYPIGAYSCIKRIVKHNLEYIGNIYALLAWYQQIRQVCQWDQWQQACMQGANTRLNEVLTERINRLEKLALAMPNSIAKHRAMGKDITSKSIDFQQKFHDAWSEFKSFFASYTPPNAPSEICSKMYNTKYLSNLKTLDKDDINSAKTWLDTIVTDCKNLVEKV